MKINVYDLLYDYDKDGRMTRNNGVNYTYNEVGLPLRETGSSYEIGLLYGADGTKLRHATEAPSGVPEVDYVNNLVYEGGVARKVLFGGGYITLQDNAYHFFVTDYQGNVRVVVKENGTVEQVNHYDPYGNSLSIGSSALTGDNPYKYAGNEWDSLSGLYDFHARQYALFHSRFASMDPLSEKYYDISPYVYCASNPVNLVDPEGQSTRVAKMGNGLYRVIGGDLSDKDLSIIVYSKDSDGNYTIPGESIGKTTSLTSFYNSDFTSGDQKGAWVVGAEIDLKDNSGMAFINKVAHAHDTLVEYAQKALPGGEYDFKVSNGSNEKREGNLKPYRGMPVGRGSKGTLYISSARDIGNFAAGYKAGSKGLSWSTTRFFFDMLQSYQDKGPSIEGESTQNAERFGWEQGQMHRK